MASFFHLQWLDRMAARREKENSHLGSIGVRAKKYSAKISFHGLWSQCHHEPEVTQMFSFVFVCQRGNWKSSEASPYPPTQSQSSKFVNFAQSPASWISKTLPAQCSTAPTGWMWCKTTPKSHFHQVNILKLFAFTSERPNRSGSACRRRLVRPNHFTKFSSVFDPKIHHFKQKLFAFKAWNDFKNSFLDLSLSTYAVS